jgi:5-methylcytosine-specific restriction protein A
MSPSILMRMCTVPGCPALVKSGRCPQHTRQADHHRGSAASRGYDSRWRARRQCFFNRLIALGIVPVCGARLPGAPLTDDSLCAAQGFLNQQRLHLDHIVPRQGPDDPRFWDPLNWQVLCGPRCHARKTATKDGGFGR